MTASPARFRDRSITFANGSVGHNIDIPSANPSNYYQAISRPADMARVGHRRQAVPAAGQADSDPAAARHRHTRQPGRRRLASGARGDIDRHRHRRLRARPVRRARRRLHGRQPDAVLVRRQRLRRAGGVEGAERRQPDRCRRIGAQGHSRGGSAVLSAATRRFADSAVGTGKGLKAVLAAYPWSGHQFLDPGVGDTEVRILMGDRDEWCSPMQVQGHAQAIRLAGGKATLRLFGGVAHSFDRGTPLQRIDEASVSPAAPTTYLADDGAFIHPLECTPNPALVDRDLMVYALKAGYGSQGRGDRHAWRRGEPVSRRHDRVLAADAAGLRETVRSRSWVGDNCMRIEGKVAIVTGAASGIGAACAETLARAGAKVIATDVDRAGGEGVVRRIAAAGRRCPVPRSGRDGGGALAAGHGRHASSASAASTSWWPTPASA